MNCIFLVLKGSGWILSLVQTIFPKFAILKLEIVFPCTSASTLKQEATYSDKHIRQCWCSKACGLCLLSWTLAYKGALHLCPATCHLPTSSENCIGKTSRGLPLVSGGLSLGFVSISSLCGLGTQCVSDPFF